MWLYSHPKYTLDRATKYDDEIWLTSDGKQAFHGVDPDVAAACAIVEAELDKTVRRTLDSAI